MYMYTSKSSVWWNQYLYFSSFVVFRIRDVDLLVGNISVKSRPVTCHRHPVIGTGIGGGGGYGLFQGDWVVDTMYGTSVFLLLFEYIIPASRRNQKNTFECNNRH